MFIQYLFFGGGGDEGLRGLGWFGECAQIRKHCQEAIFDAMPGDLFVLRNVGNSFTHAEGAERALFQRRYRDVTLNPKP